MNHVALHYVAKQWGVSTQTVKIWLREEGFNRPKPLGKGRYTILVPLFLIERIAEKHSVRMAK